MTATHPWMKFFPTDWRGDQALRICSLEARGLWIECLCLMHEAEPYGYLKINGRALDDGYLAKLTGMAPARIGELMAELETAGVFSRNKDGVAFSRRMICDARRRRAARLNGQKGGNPKLMAHAADDNDGTDGLKRGVKAGHNIQSPEAQSPQIQTPNPEIPEGQGKKDGPPPDDCHEVNKMAADVLMIDAALREWAAGKAPDADVVLELEKFTDHSRAHGRQWANPRAGFQNWLRRAQTFAEEDGRAGQRVQPLPPAERWTAVKALMRKDVLNTRTYRDLIEPLSPISFEPLTLTGPALSASIRTRLRDRWGADIVFAGPAVDGRDVTIGGAVDGVVNGVVDGVPGGECA